MPKIPKPTSVNYKWWHKHKPSVLPKSGVGELLKDFEKLSTDDRIQLVQQGSMMDSDKQAKVFATLEQRIRDVQKVASAKKDCADFHDGCTELLKLLRAEWKKFNDALQDMLDQHNSQSPDVAEATDSTKIALATLERWKSIRADQEHEARGLEAALAKIEQDLPNATTMDEVKDLMARTKGTTQSAGDFVKKWRKMLGHVEHALKDPDVDKANLKQLAKMKAELETIETDLVAQHTRSEQLEEAAMLAGKNLKGTKKAGKEFLAADPEAPKIKQRKRTQEEIDDQKLRVQGRTPPKRPAFEDSEESSEDEQPIKKKRKKIEDSSSEESSS